MHQVKLSQENTKDRDGDTSKSPLFTERPLCWTSRCSKGIGKTPPEDGPEKKFRAPPGGKKSGLNDSGLTAHYNLTSTATNFPALHR